MLSRAVSQCKGSRPVMPAAAMAAGPCSSKGKRTTIQAPTAAVPSRTRSGAARRTRPRRRAERPPSQQQQLKPCRSCLDDGTSSKSQEMLQANKKQLAGACISWINNLLHIYRRQINSRIDRPLD
jgi:hypothetical protein